MGKATVAAVCEYPLHLDGVVSTSQKRKHGYDVHGGTSEAMSGDIKWRTRSTVVPPTAW